jgi:hypothetical protein
MTQDEVRRLLKTVRFSPTKGRRLTMAWVASRSGYSREHLHRVAMNGRISEQVAKHIGRAFQSVINRQNQGALSFAAEYWEDADLRGGARPVRRSDDGRLRSARQLKAESGVNASAGPHGETTENARSRRPHDGGTSRIPPHGSGRRSKQTPWIAEKPNAAQQALERGPTKPPVIYIDVGALIKKLVR